MSEEIIRMSRNGRFLRNHFLKKRLFTKAECEKAINFFKQKTFMQATVVDGEKSKGNAIESISMNDIRKGHLVFANHQDKEMELFFKKLYQVAVWSNFGWSVIPFEFLQITEYDSSTDGGFYKRHRDIIVDQHPQRIISVVTQLSAPESYTGCDLVFDKGSGMPEANKFKDQGDTIFFLSDEPHEVTPITSGVRYSMVGWFCGPTCWTNETLPSHF